QESQLRARGYKETAMKYRFSSIAVVCVLLTGCALGQSTPQATGSVQGAVFTTEQDNSRLVVPGTKVSLDGPTHLESESNGEGTFIFGAVPVGSYKVTAQAPGLTATQNLEVRAGTVSQLDLEMKIEGVSDSTTVSASTEPVETKESSGSNIVGQSAVE